MKDTTAHIPTAYLLVSKIKDYFLLTKFTATFVVAYTCVISYLLAPNVNYNLLSILVLFIASIFITGGAIAINQTIEKDTDALMQRTAKRPLPDGRMTTKESSTFAVILSIIGLGLMWFYFNAASAQLSLYSLILYAFIYTPMKTRGPLAILVGVVTGALPCLIGWVAATGQISPFAHFQGMLADGHIATFSNWGGYVLFGIQFLWQFPHLWSIGWLAHEDYARAGINMLPSKSGPTKLSAYQILIYTLVMVPFGVLPYYLNISGIVSFWIILFCNLWMVAMAIRLLIKMDKPSAKGVMFSAFANLIIVFLSMLADKI